VGFRQHLDSKSVTDTSLVKIAWCLQNAGAVIGKGGSNIKRLRQDVSHYYCFFLIIFYCCFWLQNCIYLRFLTFSWNIFADHVLPYLKQLHWLPVQMLWCQTLSIPSVTTPASVTYPCMTNQQLTPHLAYYIIFQSYLSDDTWLYSRFHTCTYLYLIISIHLCNVDRNKLVIWWATHGLVVSWWFLT